MKKTPSGGRVRERERYAVEKLGVPKANSSLYAATWTILDPRQAPPLLADRDAVSPLHVAPRGLMDKDKPCQHYGRRRTSGSCAEAKTAQNHKHEYKRMYKRSFSQGWWPTRIANHLQEHMYNRRMCHVKR